VRDVAGHAIWGQRRLRAWATGEDYGEPGGPGSPNPGLLATTDPVATWRVARTASVAALTEEALHRRLSLPGLGEIPLAGVVTLLTADLVARLGHRPGRPPRPRPGRTGLRVGAGERRAPATGRTSIEPTAAIGHSTARSSAASRSGQSSR
jgi:hypothetical protein